jgi:hypothetical protein
MERRARGVVTGWWPWGLRKKDGERLRRPFQNPSIELFIGRWL